MGEFIRERLPDAISFFEGECLPLKGPGKWRTAHCQFHGGSDSMRVNTESGSWVCMACGEKGGDVLAFAMRAHDLGFVAAARMLGAYVDDRKPHRGTVQATTLSARDAMAVVAFEIVVLMIVIADIRNGLIPTDADWQRFVEGAGRIQTLVAEYAA